MVVHVSLGLSCHWVSISRTSTMGRPFEWWSIPFNSKPLGAIGSACTRTQPCCGTGWLNHRSGRLLWFMLSLLQSVFPQFVSFNKTPAKWQFIARAKVPATVWREAAERWLFHDWFFFFSPLVWHWVKYILVLCCGRALLSFPDPLANAIKVRHLFFQVWLAIKLYKVFSLKSTYFSCFCITFGWLWFSAGWLTSASGLFVLPCNTLLIYCLLYMSNWTIQLLSLLSC